VASARNARRRFMDAFMMFRDLARDSLGNALNESLGSRPRLSTTRAELYAGALNQLSVASIRVFSALSAALRAAAFAISHHSAIAKGR
jgi:hypothetical protein